MNYLNYIFLDLEWNQPKGRAGMVTAPIALYGEIIRIGAVRVDDNMNITARYHDCVIPKYYKKMNHAVQKLTGLEASSITYGYKFPAAYSRFKEWSSGGVILTWGDEDKKIMDSNILIHGMKADETVPWYDLQRIYAYMIVKDGRQHSLQSALEYYGLDQELKAHNALNDAIYASRVGEKMDFRDYLENYDRLLLEAEKRKEEMKKEKFYKTFLNVPSISAALSNSKIMDCRCPMCRQDMTSREWVRVREDIFINCARCSEHEDFFVRIKMRRCNSGTYAVTRRYTHLTAECSEYYARTALKSETDNEKISLI